MRYLAWKNKRPSMLLLCEDSVGAISTYFPHKNCTDATCTTWSDDGPSEQILVHLCGDDFDEYDVSDNSDLDEDTSQFL